MANTEKVGLLMFMEIAGTHCTWATFDKNENSLQFDWKRRGKSSVKNIWREFQKSEEYVFKVHL